MPDRSSPKKLDLNSLKSDALKQGHKPAEPLIPKKTPALRPPQPQLETKLSKQEQLKQQQKSQQVATPTPSQRLRNEKSIINTLSTLFSMEMDNKNKSIPTWQKSAEAAVERIALQIRTNPNNTFMQLRNAFFMNYRGNPNKINQAFNQYLNLLVQAYRQTQKEVKITQKRHSTQFDPNNPDSTRNILQTTGAEQFNFIFRQKVAALEMALLAEANELAMANQAIDQKEEEDQAEDNINAYNLEYALEATPKPETAPDQSATKTNEAELAYTAKLLEPRPEAKSNEAFQEVMESNAEAQESLISKFFSWTEKAAILVEEATATAVSSFRPTKAV